MTRIWSMAILTAALLFATAYDGIHLRQDRLFNRSIASAGYIPTGEFEDEYRQFARAYALQQQGDFKAAVEAYALIEAHPTSLLSRDIKYNLANLYLRKAMQLRDAGNDDLAMPLLELAKQGFREVLRDDDGEWDARFNLELALILAPEADRQDIEGERNPERSPRAISRIPARDALP